MDEKKQCVHSVDTGNYALWCSLFNRSASCDGCTVPGPAEDRIHRVGSKSKPRSEYDKQREIALRYGGSALFTGSMSRSGIKRWVAGPHHGSIVELTQLAAAGLLADDATKLLMARPGVTRIQDEFLIDESLWVSPVKVNETITHEGQTCRVTAINGPLVTLSLSRKTCDIGFTVMDWEIKKIGIVKRFGKWVKRVWQTVSNIQIGS